MKFFRKFTKSHSELCPVCHGTGEVKTSIIRIPNYTVESVRKCHGCKGHGWVQVKDNNYTLGVR